MSPQYRASLKVITDPDDFISITGGPYARDQRLDRTDNLSRSPTVEIPFGTIYNEGHVLSSPTYTAKQRHIRLVLVEEPSRPIRYSTDSSEGEFVNGQFVGLAGFKELNDRMVLGEILVFSDCSTNSVEHVIGMGFENHLDPARGKPPKENAHPRLAGRVQVRLRTLHYEQSTGLCRKSSENHRKRVRQSKAHVWRAYPITTWDSEAQREYCRAWIPSRIDLNGPGNFG